MATSDHSAFKRYFYSDGGQRRGPVTFDELRQLAASDKLSRSDIVWQEGEEKGKPASWVRGLFTTESSGSVPSTVTRFFYSQHGSVHGPVSASELKRLVVEGAILSSALIWKEGTTRKITAENAVRLFGNTGRSRPVVDESAQPPCQPRTVYSGARPDAGAASLTSDTRAPSATIDLPVMRINISFWRTQVIAVYEDRILRGSRYLLPLRIAEEHCLPQGRGLLQSKLHRCRTALFERVASVVEECARPRLSAAGVAEEHGKSAMLIRSAGGGKLRIALPASQAPGVRRAIASRVGDRFSIGERPSKVLAVILLTLSAILCPPAFIGAVIALLEHDDSILLALLMAVLGGTTLSVGIVLYRRVKPGVSLDEWRIQGAKAIRRYHRPIWSWISVKRKNGTPYRSKLAGWACKTIGLTYFVIIVSPLTDGFSDYLDKAFPSNTQAKNLFWTVALSPAALLVYLGYQLCQKPYNPKDRKDNRRPIVFLRPFTDDQSTSLQPVGWLAKLSGVRPNHGISYSHEAVASDMNAPAGRLSQADLLMSIHPARLMRMFFNIGVDTSEECLVRFFESYGPVVAIGRPGQALSAPGAQRMYCDDASWQSAVIAELERAQAIVIQPGITPGVRWELEQIRRRVEPFRVLICLVAYWRDPERYDDLRKFIRDNLNAELSRRVPFSEQFSFVWFERDWTPRLQPISYKNPIFWPITGDATDLQYTLQPFLQGMHGGQREEPREPRWPSWRLSTALSTVAALSLAVVVSLAPVLGLRFVASVVPSPWAIKSAIAQQEEMLHLQGKSVPYELQLPKAWTAAAPEQAIIEYKFKTPSGGELYVIASREQDDLSGLAEALLAGERDSLGDKGTASLEKEETAIINGRPFKLITVKVQITAVATVVVRCAAHTGEIGTVIVKALIRDTWATAAELAAVERIIKSVRFREVGGSAETRNSPDPFGATPN